MRKSFNRKAGKMMRTPWIMTQTWEHLLFMHWEVEPETLKQLLPSGLELDLFEGRAWLTILPFQVTHQRFRGIPEIPLLNSFSQLNVRTYVLHENIQGIYFFSVDADHPLSVFGAKAAALPFHYAKISFQDRMNTFMFSSSRMLEDACFKAIYEPLSEPEALRPGSLDYWLLERYSLFTNAGGQLFRYDVRHKHWEAGRAAVTIAENTVSPVEHQKEPELLHYVIRKKCLIYPISNV